MIRNVVGAHEEVHTSPCTGTAGCPSRTTRTRARDTQDARSPSSRTTSSPGRALVSLGRTQKDTLGWAMSGAANGIPNLLLGGASRPGDYYYGSTFLDSQWLGQWGIMRIPTGTVADLKPLPDKPAPVAAASPWPALKPGAAIAPPP